LLLPQYSLSPLMPLSSHTTSQDSVPTWLPHWRLHVHSPARRSSLEAGSTREKRGAEERKIRKKLRVIVWHGKQKRRWRARVYPERGNEVDLSLRPLELWAPCKARLLWAGAVAKYLFWPRAHCSSPRPAAPRRSRSRRKTTRQMFSGAALSLAAMYLRRVRVVGRYLRGGRATSGACLSRSYAACACGTKHRRGPPAALSGANRANI
jgi:hypothetical protein